MYFKNKWFYAALIWFFLGIYALIFRENSGTHLPPFPHFDKLAHALLFFAQIWLAAKIWLTQSRQPPYQALLIFGLAYAIVSELAQHFFTQTRSGDIWDIGADLLGTTLALFLAKIRVSLWQKTST